MWRLTSDGYPNNGDVCVIQVTGPNRYDPELTADNWYNRIATYCDGEWYWFRYDHITGVLRKEIYNSRIRAYCPIREALKEMTE